MIDVVAKAVDRVGLVKLARQLGIKHQSFYSWTRVPAERVLSLEKATGIHRSEIRPDIYPPRRKASAA